MHSGGDHQIVKAYFLNPDARTIGVNGSGSQIDADNFSQEHGNILLLRFKLSNWRRHLGRRKDRGRHLIQEWLEDVMVATIDHDDFGIAMSQRFCRGNTGEPAADITMRGLLTQPPWSRTALAIATFPTFHSSQSRKISCGPESDLAPHASRGDPRPTRAVAQGSSAVATALFDGADAFSTLVRTQ